MKIEMEVKPARHYAYNPPHARSEPLLKCKPFFASNQGTFTHRVRSATAHWRNGKLNHLSLTFWCGANGFVDKGELRHEPGTDRPLCGICYGRHRNSLGLTAPPNYLPD